MLTSRHDSHQFWRSRSKPGSWSCNVCSRDITTCPSTHLCFGGGFSKICWNFHPETWGRWTHFDEHIFQMGWFNHQLAVFFFWGGGWFVWSPWGREVFSLVLILNFTQKMEGFLKILDSSRFILTGSQLPSGRSFWKILNSRSCLVFCWQLWAILF